MGLTCSFALDDETAVATLRVSRGEDSFAAAWAAGRALTVEEALRLALTLGDHRDSEAAT